MAFVRGKLSTLLSLFSLCLCEWDMVLCVSLKKCEKEPQTPIFHKE